MDTKIPEPTFTEAKNMTYDTVIRFATSNQGLFNEGVCIFVCRLMLNILKLRHGFRIFQAIQQCVIIAMLTRLYPKLFLII